MTNTLHNSAPVSYTHLADFVYLENADDINMKQANGKIVMVNNYMSRTMLEKLVKAGALGFVSFSGTPIDTGKKRLPAAKNLSQSKTLAEIPGTCIHFVDAAELVEKGALRVRCLLYTSHLNFHQRQLLLLLSDPFHLAAFQSYEAHSYIRCGSLQHLPQDMLCHLHPKMDTDQSNLHPDEY